MKSADEAKKQLNLTQYTEGTGKDADKGYQVNIQFDATGITLRNVSDPKLQRDARAWHNKSQLMYNQGKNWNLKEVKKEDDILEIGLNRAIDLITQAIEKRALNPNPTKRTFGKKTFGKKTKK